MNRPQAYPRRPGRPVECHRQWDSDTAEHLSLGEPDSVDCLSIRPVATSFAPEHYPPEGCSSGEHCIDDVTASSLFTVRYDASRTPCLVAGVRNLPTPSIDFTMIVLGVDATEIIPEITPIEMNRDPVAEGWLVGRWMLRLRRDHDNLYHRSTASVEATDFDGETVIVDGKGEHICYGDSGGPILWQPDADTAPVLVGTEQWGDSSCVTWTTQPASMLLHG